MYPAYDAFETFLFVPNHTTDKGSHIRDAIDLKRTMFMVIIALIPCLLFGICWSPILSCYSSRGIIFRQIYAQFLEVSSSYYCFICCWVNR